MYLGKGEMEELSIVGKSVPRIEGVEKVTGKAKYCTDVVLPKMLHAKVLRSKYPHARILSIDTSEVEKLPGAKAVITAGDTTKQKIEVIVRGIPDFEPLAMDKVRYVGQEIAAVAAEDELIAEEALRLIKVDYEELPAVFDPEEAMKPEAPLIHDVERNIIGEFATEFGDVEIGFREADYIFEDRFSTQYFHMCHLEPTVCIASFDSFGKLTFYDNHADPFRQLRLAAKALGIPASKAKTIQKFLPGNGGSWQGDLSPYVITALLAKKTGRPVRLVYTREEELSATRPRLPVITYVKTGVKKDGTFTARHFRVVSTAGASAGYAPIMTPTGLVDTAGLYRCPNVRLEGKTVYTNTAPTGPARAFGIQQPQFAQEAHLDRVAEELGIDPIELRLKNAIRTGDVSVCGQNVRSCGLQECIEKVADYAGWKQKRANKQPNRGMGMACIMDHCDNRESDFGGSIAYVKVLEDGRFRIISGEFEWGQGAHTVLCQVAAEVLGVPMEIMEFSELDTDVVPYTLGPYGGGRMMTTGVPAVAMAAAEAKKELLATAAHLLGARFVPDLEIKDQQIVVRGTSKSVSIADVAHYARYAGKEIVGKAVYDPGKPILDLKTLHSDYSSGYIFYAQVAEVEVDPETGRVMVLNIANAVDIGKAFNPMFIIGQSEGGVSQDLGMALMEGIMYDQGMVMNPNFMNYKVLTSMDMPPVKTFLVESNTAEGIYGGKGCGHTGIATAPAIANAIYNAVGVRIKDLPITPMKILKALEEKGEGR